MNERFKLDAIDKTILSMLSENARTPFLEIARKCGVSGAAIHQRVHKLEESKIILGSKLTINAKSLGYNTCAYVGVYLEKASMYRKVVEEISKIPEIVECHYTTGHYAIFLKLFCKDNENMMQVLNDTLQKIPGVASTETFISLEQPINRQVIY